MKSRIIICLFICLFLFTGKSFGQISSGTHSIGLGLDFDTIDLFVADLVTLTGNLRGEHNDEDTPTSTDVVITIDTSTFTLTLTAQSGEKHNGTFGNATHQAGDGARIVFGASDSLTVDEASDGTLNNIVISDLVFDCKATSSDGILFVDGGNTGTLLLERCIFEGDGNSDDGIVLSNTAFNVIVRNCDVHGFGAAGSLGFRGTPSTTASTVYTFDNNTVAKCTVGMSIPDSTIDEDATITFRNNLLQGNTTGFSIADGTGPYTTSKNWSEVGGGSPDSLEEDFHNGTSNFVDYDGNNYLIASDGDSLTNLADGTDLTGTFEDDIIDNTRTAADFFVGSSWIDTGAAPAAFVPSIQISQYINNLIEQCYLYN